MSICWIFHAEVRSGVSWAIPNALTPTATKIPPIGGEFGWMKDHRTSAGLFFGADALFRFSSGRPPGPSEFCQLWDEYCPGWDSDGERAVHWIDSDQLYVDLWNDPMVLVESYAAVRLAGLFSDGTQAFPQAALLMAGATKNDLWLLHKLARPTSLPRDRLRGAGRNEIEKRRPEHEVVVSWQTSINALFPSCADAFRRLRQLGDATNLRVIALRG
jgi:hypothetical protein